jgi:hypothetical protein
MYFLIKNDIFMYNIHLIFCCFNIKKMSYQPLINPDASSQVIPPLSSSSSRRTAPRSPFVCGEAIQQCFESVIYFIIHVLPSRSQVIGYMSGGLFAIGWWIFIDGITLTTAKAGQNVCTFWKNDNFSQDKCLVEPVRFEDWVPGIFSTLSLIM